MKLDTQAKGLETLVKPYVAVLLKKLWASASKGDGLVSGELYDFYNDRAREMGKPTRSRASIIFSLNDLVDEGVLAFDDVTGKGGHARSYYPQMTPDQYKNYVINTVTNKVIETFSGDGWWRLDGGTSSGRAPDSS